MKKVKIPKDVPILKDFDIDKHYQISQDCDKGKVIDMKISYYDDKELIKSNIKYFKYVTKEIRCGVPISKLKEVEKFMKENIYVEDVKIEYMKSLNSCGLEKITKEEYEEAKKCIESNEKNA